MRLSVLVFILVLAHAVSAVPLQTNNKEPAHGRPPASKLYYDDLMNLHKKEGRDGFGYAASWDERSFIVDNRPTLFLGGSVHYPRIPETEWRRVMMQMREAGLNHVQTYVFWNWHQPDSPDQEFDFSSPRRNLTDFIQAAAEAGLFVNLRLGPYVCAEWQFGGLPWWLTKVPGIEFRVDNGPWKAHMQSFVERVMDEVRPWLAENGGNIVLAQIENELGTYGGKSSQSYANWCGDLALNQTQSLAWLMCNGMSSPKTAATCNGFDCADYAWQHITEKPGQPLAWTEDWAWFEEWDKTSDHGQDDRSPSEFSHVVARWFALGAAHHNYYMWFGGNHLGQTTGSAITNMYSDGAPIHADGLPFQSKFDKLQRLNGVLTSYVQYLLGSIKGVETKQAVPRKTAFGTTAARSKPRLAVLPCREVRNDQTWAFDKKSGLISGKWMQKEVCVSRANPSSYDLTVNDCNREGNVKWTAHAATGSSSGDVTLSMHPLISSPKHRLCLDVKAGLGPDTGVWDCKEESDSANDGNENQRWLLNADGTITSMVQFSDYAEMCLTIVEKDTLWSTEYSNGDEGKVKFICNDHWLESEVADVQGLQVHMPPRSTAVVDFNWERKPTLIYHTAFDVTKDGKLSEIGQGSNDPGLAKDEDRTWVSWPLSNSSVSAASRADEGLSQWVVEGQIDVPLPGSEGQVHTRPIDQLILTGASQDCMWYVRSLANPADKELCSGGKHLEIGGWKANTYTAFIDNTLVGNVYNDQHDYTPGITKLSMPLKNLHRDVDSQGCNLAILSCSLGINNIVNVGGAGSKQESKGILGNVKVGLHDLTLAQWWHIPANLSHDVAVTRVRSSFSERDLPPLSVARASFHVADVQRLMQQGPLSLDLTSLTRGRLWLNGVDLGKYWTVSRGGRPVQRFYLLPSDVLQNGRNSLTLWEELGGDIGSVKLVMAQQND